MTESQHQNAATLKSLILAAQDRSREKVYVEEWDLDVYIQEMSAGERLDYQKTGMKRDDAGKIVLAADGVTPVVDPEALGIFQEALLVRTLVDSEGTRLFSDDEIDDLKTKSAAVLTRLHDHAARLNKTRAQDQETIQGN